MKTFRMTLALLVASALCAVPALAVDTSNLTFDVGGFLKTDGTFIGGAVNSTDAPRWAVDSDNAQEDTFTATVQHSRLWLSLDHDKVGETGALRIYAEADLFNLGDIPDSSKYNNNQMRMRQLYVDYGQDLWSVRIGQAWDIFSPLNPTSFNTNGNLWFGGNPGFRRPQARFTIGQDDEQVAHLKGEVSLNANLATTGGEPSGQNSGLPVVEGRVSIVMPVVEGQTATFGLSGLWGQEEIDDAVVGGADANQYAIGLDMNLALSDGLLFKGELQYGANTDTYLTGGGVDTANGDELKSFGGWGQVIFKLAPDIALNGYFGFEDIDSVEVPDGSNITSNLVFGGQFRYDFFDICAAGVEFTHYKTKFQGAGTEKANALWFTFLYDF